MLSHLTISLNSKEHFFSASPIHSLAASPLSTTPVNKVGKSQLGICCQQNWWILILSYFSRCCEHCSLFRLRPWCSITCGHNFWFVKTNQLLLGLPCHSYQWVLWILPTWRWGCKNFRRLLEIFSKENSSLVSKHTKGRIGPWLFAPQPGVTLEGTRRRTRTGCQWSGLGWDPWLAQYPNVSH